MVCARLEVLRLVSLLLCCLMTRPSVSPQLACASDLGRRLRQSLLMTAAKCLPCQQPAILPSLYQARLMMTVWYSTVKGALECRVAFEAVLLLWVSFTYTRLPEGVSIAAPGCVPPYSTYSSLPDIPDNGCG